MEFGEEILNIFSNIFTEKSTLYNNRHYSVVYLELIVIGLLTNNDMCYK